MRNSIFRTGHKKMMNLFNVFLILMLSSACSNKSDEASSKQDYAVISFKTSSGGGLSTLALSTEYCYAVHVVGIPGQTMPMGNHGGQSCPNEPKGIGRLEGLFDIGDTAIIQVPYDVEVTYDIIGIPKSALSQSPYYNSERCNYNRMAFAFQDKEDTPTSNSQYQNNFDQEEQHGPPIILNGMPINDEGIDPLLFARGSHTARKDLATNDVGLQAFYSGTVQGVPYGCESGGGSNSGPPIKSIPRLDRQWSNGAATGSDYIVRTSMNPTLFKVKCPLGVTHVEIEDLGHVVTFTGANTTTYNGSPGYSCSTLINATNYSIDSGNKSYAFEGSSNPSPTANTYGWASNKKRIACDASTQTATFYGNDSASPTSPSLIINTTYATKYSNFESLYYGYNSMAPSAKQDCNVSSSASLKLNLLSCSGATCSIVKDTSGADRSYPFNLSYRESQNTNMLSANPYSYDSYWKKDLAGGSPSFAGYVPFDAGTSSLAKIFIREDSDSLIRLTLNNPVKTSNSDPDLYFACDGEITSVGPPVVRSCKSSATSSLNIPTAWAGANYTAKSFFIGLGNLLHFFGNTGSGDYGPARMLATDHNITQSTLENSGITPLPSSWTQLSSDKLQKAEHSNGSTAVWTSSGPGQEHQKVTIYDEFGSTIVFDQFNDLTGINEFSFLSLGPNKIFLFRSDKYIFLGMYSFGIKTYKVLEMQGPSAATINFSAGDRVQLVKQNNSNGTERIDLLVATTNGGSTAELYTKQNIGSLIDSLTVPASSSAVELSSSLVYPSWGGTAQINFVKGSSSKGISGSHDLIAAGSSSGLPVLYKSFDAGASWYRVYSSNDSAFSCSSGSVSLLDAMEVNHYYSGFYNGSMSLHTGKAWSYLVKVTGGSNCNYTSGQLRVLSVNDF